MTKSQSPATIPSRSTYLMPLYSMTDSSAKREGYTSAMPAPDRRGPYKKQEPIGV
jgi:hypothetical protein